MRIEFANPGDAMSRGLPVDDVYLHPRYGRSAELIDGGVWECAFDSDNRIAFPYIRRPVNRVTADGLYDIVSPYGYGGLSTGPAVDENTIREFRATFLNTSRDRGLIAEFLRLSPFYDHTAFIGTATSIEHRDTFGSLVESPDDEFRNTSGQHRTAVRKAEKNGVSVVEVASSTLIYPQAPFRRIYDATMERVASRQSLRLGSEYFERLCQLPTGCVRVLEAWHEDEAVAAAIFLVWGDHVHYHLSGSTLDGRRLQATDMIIDQAVRNLIDPPFRLHLGGGYSAGDSLSKFKRQSSSAVFTMTFSRLVVNEKVYRELSSGIATEFFPAYRAPTNLMMTPANRGSST